MTEPNQQQHTNNGAGSLSSEHMKNKDTRVKLLESIKPHIYNEQREMERLAIGFGQFPYPNNDYGVKPVERQGTAHYDFIPITAISDSVKFDISDPDCSFIFHVAANHDMSKFYMNIYALNGQYAFNNPEITRDRPVISKTSLDDINQDVENRLIELKCNLKLKPDTVAYIQRGSHFQKIRFDRRASTIEGVLNIIKVQYPQDDRSKWYIQVAEVRRFSKIIRPEDFVRFEMLTDSAYSDEKLINVLLYA
ncbi:hypothetical protein BGX26_008666 [Mortierella sp. AD094]|nr:hypothetical protein BGX26_008666 [Mortierella sp. AD094]